jgi:hypothetical protein
MTDSVSAEKQKQETITVPQTTPEITNSLDGLSSTLGMTELRTPNFEGRLIHIIQSEEKGKTFLKILRACGTISEA